MTDEGGQNGATPGLRVLVAGRGAAIPEALRGVDYDRPAEIHRCGDCGQTTDEPVVGFIWMDCGKHTDAEKAEKRVWYHCRLTPQGVSALKAGASPVALPGCFGALPCITAIPMPLSRPTSAFDHSTVDR